MDGFTSTKYDDLKDLLLNKKACYLDIPLHFNIGDLLIYKGTELFFKNNNINIIYRSFNFNIDHNQVAKSDIILLHGGGNFGDLYLKHQKFREDIIKKYPEKKIICLPQSIHFSNQKSLEQSMDIFRQHTYLYIFVRDKPSFEIAKSFSSNTFLVPDMAHFLSSSNTIKKYKSAKADNEETLIFQRRDKESTSQELGNDNDQSKFSHSFDWIDIIDKADKSLLKISSYLAKVYFSNPLYIFLWSKITNRIVLKSIKHFSQFNKVETDRLHGCILACLLNIPVDLKDNSYKKNTRYATCWLNEHYTIRTFQK